MPLISEGRFVADIWTRPAQEEALKPGARYILPLDRLVSEGETLVATGAVLGVEIPNNAALALLGPWLARLELIVVAFPKSADGRGFSIAARLRRLGYTRELRAIGHVIPDQYALAKSSGFDAVEISDALAARQPETQWTAAAHAMSWTYQHSSGPSRSILGARWGN